MRKLILAGCLLTALCLAACGGSVDGGESTAAPPAAAETPAPAAGTDASVPETASPAVAAPDPEQGEAPASAAPGADLAAVREAMLSRIAFTDPLPLETESLASLYGIEPEWVAQSACFVTMSGVFPDEVILAQGADEAAAARIAEKLEARLAEILEQARSYDPESYAAAQRCGVTVDGTYVSLILSAQADALTEIYREFVP